MPVFLISGSWTPDIRIDGRRRFRWGLRRRRPPPMCGRRSGSHVCGRAAAECPLQVRAEGPGHLRWGASADRGSLFAVLHPLLLISVSGRIPGGSSALKPSPGRYLRKTYAADYCAVTHLFRRMVMKYAGESSYAMQKGRMIRSHPPDLQGSAGLPPPFREMSFPTQE